MIKPSKYLLIFVSLFLLLGLALFITTQKFLPVLLQHTVYYCQSMLQSFSMQIPGGTGFFLGGLLILLIGYVMTKLLSTYIKVISFRGKLHVHTKSNSTFESLIAKLDLQDDAFLVENGKPFAFCHGIRHPRIYISTALFKMMNKSEFEAILRHEKYHLDHKDSFIMLLAEIAKSMFFFFPLLSDLIYNYRIEREIKADQWATHDLDNSKPLVSVLKKLLLCEPIDQFAFAPALADHETLEMRIKALINKKYNFLKFKPVNVLISFLTISIFMILVIAPVEAIEMREDDSRVMMVCLQNDACAVWCKENSAVIPYSKAPNASYPDTPMTRAVTFVE